MQHFIFGHSTTCRRQRALAYTHSVMDVDTFGNGYQYRTEADLRCDDDGEPRANSERDDGATEWRLDNVPETWDGISGDGYGEGF